MNDSVDRVIEEWEALACAHGVSRKSYGDVEFRRVASLAHTAAAAWAPNAAPYILGIIGPDSDRGAQFRKGTLADLRAALGLPAWVAPPAPWSDDSELRRVERAEAAEIALTIRLNPNAAESIPGTDWQVDYPGQYSSHPNAQAAWIEAGIVLGVLDDGEGVAGLTRELLTRVEQIEALLVKRAQELEEARKEIDWLKRAWMACRRVICEMSDVQAAREELTDATRRLSAAQAERMEAEREPNDQW